MNEAVINLLVPSPFFAEDNNLIGFTNFGGMDVGDDSSSIVILSSAKPYRELIGSGTISIFDFRVYLFTRQASLLLAVGRIADLAKRGSMFISTFARALRENQVSTDLYAAFFFPAVIFEADCASSLLALSRLYLVDTSLNPGRTLLACMSWRNASDGLSSTRRSSRMDLPR